MPRLKEIIHYGSPFPKQHERERERLKVGFPNLDLDNIVPICL
jgi:hypothetical protein